MAAVQKRGRPILPVHILYTWRSNLQHGTTLWDLLLHLLTSSYQIFLAKYFSEELFSDHFCFHPLRKNPVNNIQNFPPPPIKKQQMHVIPKQIYSLIKSRATPSAPSMCSYSIQIEYIWETCQHSERVGGIWYYHTISLNFITRHTQLSLMSIVKKTLHFYWVSVSAQKHPQQAAQLNNRK